MDAAEKRLHHPLGLLLLILLPGVGVLVLPVQIHQQLERALPDQHEVVRHCAAVQREMDGAMQGDSRRHTCHRAPL